MCGRRSLGGGRVIEGVVSEQNDFEGDTILHGEPMNVIVTLLQILSTPGVAFHDLESIIKLH